MQAQITVVIPTYNRRHEIGRAIASVKAQTLQGVEIIVVDDGSTDGTREFMAALHPDVTYIAKANGGVSTARNVGWRAATTPFVAFLDSDDYWAPGWLEAAIGLLDQQSDLGVVCARMTLVDADGSMLKTLHDVSRLVPDGIPTLPLLWHGRIGASIVVRRDLLLQVGGYDESLRTGEDIDLAIRLAVIARVYRLDEPMVFVVRTPGSLSARVNTGSRLRVLQKFEREHPDVAHQYRAEVNRSMAYFCLDYGRELTVQRELGLAQERLVQAWRLRPSGPVLVQMLKVAVLRLLTFVKKPA